jgi:hypothetical protein
MALWQTSPANLPRTRSERQATHELTSRVIAFFRQPDGQNWCKLSFGYASTTTEEIQGAGTG